MVTSDCRQISSGLHSLLQISPYFPKAWGPLGTLGTPLCSTSPIPAIWTSPTGDRPVHPPPSTSKATRRPAPESRRKMWRLWPPGTPKNPLGILGVSFPGFQTFFCFFRMRKIWNKSFKESLNLKKLGKLSTHLDHLKIQPGPQKAPLPKVQSTYSPSKVPLSTWYLPLCLRSHLGRKSTFYLHPWVFQNFKIPGTDQGASPALRLPNDLQDCEE